MELRFSRRKVLRWRFEDSHAEFWLLEFDSLDHIFLVAFFYEIEESDFVFTDTVYQTLSSDSLPSYH